MQWLPLLFITDIQAGSLIEEQVHRLYEDKKDTDRFIPSTYPRAEPADLLKNRWQLGIFSLHVYSAGVADSASVPGQNNLEEWQKQWDQAPQDATG